MRSPFARTSITRRCRNVRRERRRLDRRANVCSTRGRSHAAELYRRGRDLRPVRRTIAPARADRRALRGLRVRLGPARRPAARLGRQATHIVATASYEFTDLSVTSQVESIRAAGADTSSSARRRSRRSRLSWQLHAPAGSPLRRRLARDRSLRDEVVRLTAGPASAEGAVSSGWLATDRPCARAIARRQALPPRSCAGTCPTPIRMHSPTCTESWSRNLMTDALRHAGRNPTRASLLRAVQHLQDSTTRSSFRAPRSGCNRAACSRSRAHASSASARDAGGCSDRSSRRAREAAAPSDRVVRIG